jgi:hypothetical protein
MFDLSTTAIGIRKAAALKGIWSGKVEYYDTNTYRNPLVARITNKNYLNGVDITQNQIEGALKYSWKKIKELKISVKTKRIY